MIKTIKSATLGKLSWLNSASQVIGGTVVILALAVYASSMDISDIMGWAWHVFGPIFLGFYGVLVVFTLHCINKLKSPKLSLQQKHTVHEAASHAASGISTMALTFTLLGISLGIGSLADQSLSPDNIQSVIGTLTRHFATAFMTTVVGLPSAAVLRAMLGVTRSQQIDQISIATRITAIVSKD